jgi:hypothetical protein
VRFAACTEQPTGLHTIAEEQSRHDCPRFVTVARR